MAEADRPQITLITPPVLDLEVFPDRLARVMDAVDIACLRLALATKDVDDLGRAAGHGCVGHGRASSRIAPARATVW